MKKRTPEDDIGDDSDKQRPAPIVMDPTTIERNKCIAEADTFSRQGDYAQAIPLYSKAILVQATEPLLLCLARCKSLTGDMKGALEAADQALNLHPESLKSLICKADIQFAKGDFELALVNYYRGLSAASANGSRAPEGKPSYYEAQFRSGISRCQEAISHAIEELDEKQIELLKQKLAYKKAQEQEKNSKTGKKTLFM